MKVHGMRNIQLIGLFALSLGISSISTAANYSIDDVNDKIRVSYQDLDLNSNAGVEALYQRLQHVSDIACDTGSYAKIGSLSAAHQARACFDDVLTRMVARVGHEKLTALHES